MKEGWAKYSAHMLSCEGSHTGVAMRGAVKALCENKDASKAEGCLAELLHTMHEHVRVGGVASLGIKGRGKGHREAPPGTLKHLRAVRGACADVIKLYSLHALSPCVLHACKRLNRVAISDARGVSVSLGKGKGVRVKDYVDSLVAHMGTLDGLIMQEETKYVEGKQKQAMSERIRLFSTRKRKA